VAAWPTADRRRVEMMRTEEIVEGAYLPGVERPHGNMVVFTAKDMIETVRFLQRYFLLECALADF
jgi:D-aminopeptidase